MQGKCWANLQKPGSGTIPSLNPPPTQSHKAVKQVAPPWRLPKSPPHSIYRESNQLYLIYRNKHREAAKLRRQRNMAQMKEQNKNPEELNKMEIANLLDVEFKILVIRMLKDLTEYCSNIKQETKFTLSEVKKIKESTVKGRKLGFKSMIWNIRKK